MAVSCSDPRRDPRWTELLEMNSLEIQPVVASALHDVASFLCRRRAARDEGMSVQPLVREDALRTERRLRWLLVENPLTTDASRHGFCIRDDSGVIRGLT